MAGSGQADIIAFLSKPEAYGLRGGTVERHETHGSIVFLAGERAYKLKRAVKYPYMDYATPRRREQMCRAELAVNRRMAPKLYIGVRAILRGENGALRLGGPEGDRNAIDWVVVMRQFDQEQLLERMRHRGLVNAALMRDVADRIATFHSEAEIRRDHGGAAGLHDVIEGNAAQLKQMAGQPFPPEKVGLYIALCQDAFAALGGYLDRRREVGLVRRVHGDLHLNNICLFEGKPVLFDAIEFREEFSCIDVFYDLAFLLMDVTHHGLPVSANTLLNRYLERTDDYAGVQALALFLSCRAAIRAHVTVTTAQARGTGNGDWQDSANALLDQAIAFLEYDAVRLVVVSGFSGTGKSTLAHNLAPFLGRATGAVVLRSDVIRKQLWNVPLTATLPEHAYANDVTDKVFAALTEQAEMLLKAGQSVIADAVFGRAEQRAQIREAARNAGANFHPFWLHAPLALLEQRIGTRHGDASDADTIVLHKQIAAIKHPVDWQGISAACAPEELVAQALRAIAR